MVGRVSSIVSGALYAWKFALKMRYHRTPVQPAVSPVFGSFRKGTDLKNRLGFATCRVVYFCAARLVNWGAYDRGSAIKCGVPRRGRKTLSWVSARLFGND